MHVTCLKAVLQVGRGGKLVYERRGWDLGVGRVLQAMHQDKNSDLCKAAAKAHPLPAGDAALETFWGSPYGKLLDELCKHKLSKRTGWQQAGLYVIGVR